MDIISFALSKKYTADTADSLGSLRGAPATIDGVVDNADGTHTVTFGWTGTSGTHQTTSMTVKDGTDGEDAQVSTLPAASADELGKVYQYTGATTADLTNGYFYQCIESGGSYVWIQKPVQPEGGGGEDITVTALPTASVDELGKTYILTAPQTGYETGGIYKCYEDNGSYEWRLINRDEPDELTTGQANSLLAMLN